MKKTLHILAAATLSLLPCLSHAETSVSTPGLELKNGDRFVFIGDSITHQCLYTQFVENYFYASHPGIRLHFRNAGISGDRALDVLNRFDEDIASFKPTVATILLGMNDGSYKDFDQATFDTYARDMTKLLDRLDAIKCRVVIMSPTMFDHQAWDIRVKEKPDYAKGRNVTNYNAVLAYYGKWLQQTALERGCLFVDLFAPLNQITVAQRRANPRFTLIEDAIHPGYDGQYVMARSLLEQTGEASLTGEVDPSKNLTINDTLVRGTDPAQAFAQKVVELNKRRNQEAIQPLRGLWSKQKGMLRKKDSEPAAYDAWRKEFEPKRAELDALAEKFELEIYELQKPSSQPATPAKKPVPAPAPQKKAA